MTTTERLERHSRTLENGCIEWIGSKNSKGYGRVLFKGQNSHAHRVVWEIENGPIPEGMCVCHSCDNPSCVNADHLFLGTNVDNMRDASKKKRLQNQRKTHCSHGHLFSGNNLISRNNGKRACRVCTRIWGRLYQRKKRDVLGLEAVAFKE